MIVVMMTFRTFGKTDVVAGGGGDDGLTEIAVFGFAGCCCCFI